MASMNSLTKVIIEDLKAKLNHEAHLMVFAQKVLAVLLGEVLSSTVYEILTVIMVGDGSLSNAQALIARSIYAVLISVYSPVMGWFLSKITHGKDTFWSIVLQSHANVCPVLLAWGWKNWAAALDTFAGAELWDEVVVAVSLTLLVTAGQAAPCFGKNKASIAAGGDGDTLMARFMVLPSSFGLTLGYVWNVVATFFVGKLQELESSYHFEFFVQGAYALIAGVLCTVITVLLKKRQDPSLPTSKIETRLHELNSWSGLDGAESTLKALVCTVLSFVYGWALLDTCDDWGFGVMFQCSSYSACSYQSNFAYALAVTVIFASSSFILNRCKEYEIGETRLAQALTLQLNAMVLTVGWAWMNFYSTLMSDATKAAPAGLQVLFYFTSLVVILIFHALTQFVLQRAYKGHAQRLKQAMEELEPTATQSII